MAYLALWAACAVFTLASVWLVALTIPRANTKRLKIKRWSEL